MTDTDGSAEGITRVITHALESKDAALRERDEKLVREVHSLLQPYMATLEEDVERLDWLSEYLLKKPMWSHDGRRLVELMRAGEGGHETLCEAIDAARAAKMQ